MDNTRNELEALSIRYQLTMSQVLTELGLAKDEHNARRFIELGALSVNGVVVSNPKEIADLDSLRRGCLRFLGRSLECPISLSLIGQHHLR